MVRKRFLVKSKLYNILNNDRLIMKRLYEERSMLLIIFYHTKEFGKTKENSNRLAY